MTGTSNGLEDLAPDIIGLLANYSPSSLPHDAHQQLQKLTIEIDDPQRVLAVYQASRRFNFQVVVERYVFLACYETFSQTYCCIRYILQLRYGCRSPTCTISTCFTYRIRMAGTKPIRRYTAQSAHMLAAYLASLDNAEHGLCSRLQPAASATNSCLKPPKGSSAMGALRDTSESDNQLASHEITYKRLDSLSRGSQTYLEQPASTTVDDTSAPRAAALESANRIDHRSFVQNLFDTATFGIFEWLSPRKLEALTRPHDSTKAFTDQTGLAKKTNVKSSDKGQEKDLKEQAIVQDTQKSTSVEGVDATLHTPRVHHVGPILPGKHTGKNNRAPSLCIAKRRRGGSVSILSTPLDSHKGKGHPKDRHVQDCAFCSAGDKQQHQHGNHESTDENTGFQLQDTEGNVELVPEHDPRCESSDSRSNDNDVQVSVKEDPPDKSSATEAYKSARPRSPKTRRPRQKRSADRSLPMSLSKLTIESIDLMCEILQRDRTTERHSLHPRKPDSSLREHVASSEQISLLPIPPMHDDALKVQWRTFIFQSIFDVLHKPQSLLESFSDDLGRSIDSHTLWYLMLRLTRAAPSLVFNSLWQAAESLFTPPVQLQILNGMACNGDIKTSNATEFLTTVEAAQLISIALHALVAAAPLTNDITQLAMISHARSSGRCCPKHTGGDTNKLSLLFDDIYSNELAMRLARRIFAAISTRQRFTELQANQKHADTAIPFEDDILSIILQSIESYDAKQASIVNFPETERALHEKRLPMLILDWARDVMLHDWNGKARVPADGPFGGALALLSALRMFRLTWRNFSNPSRYSTAVINAQRPIFCHRLL